MKQWLMRLPAGWWQRRRRCRSASAAEHRAGSSRGSAAAAEHRDLDQLADNEVQAALAEAAHWLVTLVSAHACTAHAGRMPRKPLYRRAPGAAVAQSEPPEKRGGVFPRQDAHEGSGYRQTRVRRHERHGPTAPRRLRYGKAAQAGGRDGCGQDALDRSQLSSAIAAADDIKYQ